jgi:hypothetical protein
MREVKNFFEQDAYMHRPDQVADYVRWALQPDGPAYHEAPTPITCKFERSHQEYIVSVVPVLMLTKIVHTLALAPERHISITFHYRGCKALSPSSKGLSSRSANQCVKSTKGTLWASACFRTLFLFFTLGYS